MNASAAASLRAATEGRAAKEQYEASAEFDPEMFTPADHAALDGTWSWFGSVVGPALETDQGGAIDDDLAYVAPWGFDAAQVRAPVLLMHGGQDRIAPSPHSEWLARSCPSAETAAVPRRRAHLGAQLRRIRPGLARGARRLELAGQRLPPSAHRAPPVSPGTSAHRSSWQYEQLEA